MSTPSWKRFFSPELRLLLEQKPLFFPFTKAVLAREVGVLPPSTLTTDKELLLWARQHSVHLQENFLRKTVPLHFSVNFHLQHMGSVRSFGSTFVGDFSRGELGRFVEELRQTSASEDPPTRLSKYRISKGLLSRCWMELERKLQPENQGVSEMLSAMNTVLGGILTRNSNAILDHVNIRMSNFVAACHEVGGFEWSRSNLLPRNQRFTGIRTRAYVSVYGSSLYPESPNNTYHVVAGMIGRSLQNLYGPARNSPDPAVVTAP